VSVAVGGSDHINTSAGPTALSLSLLNQAVTVQYASGVWVVSGGDIPLTQLDARYSSAGSASTLVSPPTGTAATDRAAIVAAITSVAGMGGIVQLRAGVYLTDQTILVPGGVTLQGVGFDYVTVTTAPARGTVLQAAPGLATPVVKMGANATSTASGDVSPVVQNLSVDAAGVAPTAIWTVSRRCYIRNVVAWRGTSVTVNMEGQNSYLMDSVIGSNSAGSSVRVANADVKVLRNQIREGGTEQLLLEGTFAGAEISGNHMYGISASGSNRPDIRINASAGSRNVRIVDNTIEGTAGPNIHLAVGAGADLANLIVTGNMFYAVNTGTGTTPVILMVNSGTIGGTVTGNSAAWTSASTSTYKAFIEQTGAGSNSLVVVGNNATDCDAFAIGFTPKVQRGNVLSTASSTSVSESGSRVTFSGDGTTTSFTFPHGLYGMPLAVAITPGSAAAAAPFYWSANTSDITVTFVSAPAAGTSNVVLGWTAAIIGSADGVAPTTPGTPTATAGTAQNALTWTASTDTVGVVGYRVYRSDAPTTILGTASSNSYTDATAVPGTAYTYKVAAYDAAGNMSAKSAASNSVTAAAAAAPFVTDSFTMANGGLTSHTGETGATWAKNGAYATTASAFSIANNRAYSSGTTSAYYYASGTPSTADYAVEGDIYVASLLTGTSCGIAGRMDTAAATAYVMRYAVSSAQWQIVKLVANTSTTLASYVPAAPPTVGGSTHIKLVMAGTTLTGLIDGAAVLSASDASITAAGKAGLAHTGAVSASATTGLHIDNLVAA
jgi:hypothetical protein